jgi:predicted house-cleaning noncanonical NTP pyrophosphatase (MazG superfamily)
MQQKGIMTMLVRDRAIGVDIAEGNIIIAADHEQLDELLIAKLRATVTELASSPRNHDALIDALEVIFTLGVSAGLRVDSSAGSRTAIHALTTNHNLSF